MLSSINTLFERERRKKKQNKKTNFNANPKVVPVKWKSYKFYIKLHKNNLPKMSIIKQNHTDYENNEIYDLLNIMWSISIL